MSIASELTKLETDITNAYSAVQTKGGTIPANKNTNNLPTAIDSIEVIEQATAEGESLSLTNTKAMPYSDYVVKGKSEQDGEPSPSNPSEIHSVADYGVNLFDKDNADIKTFYVDSSSILADNTNKYIVLSCKPNTYYSFSKTDSSFFIVNGTTTYPEVGHTDIKNRTRSYTNILENYLTTSDTNYLCIRFKDSSDSLTEQEILNTVKVEEGKTVTEYTPFGVGTVTIKQRGTTENNDYTIQTSPLSSLPNGVKDTMELQDMQNHTRIGRQTGILSQTTTITLSDAKQNGAYMCNIKSAGTLNGQTIELEAGDYEIIYELATEIIEPLTQNQATTMLDIIKTGSYEGTTNIYTDEDVKPTIGVGYYKKK